MINWLSKNPIIYLAGAIEFSENHGVTWREQFKDLLTNKYKFACQILDPCQKPFDIIKEIGEEKGIVQRLKSEGKFDELTKIMKLIRASDLRAVDQAVITVMHIDPNVPTCGSWDEAITAERQQKDLYAIVKGGVKMAPGWSFAIFDYHQMFDNVEDCVLAIVAKYNNN